MAYEEEDSGIGLGKIAAGIGALGTAVVFRKNIGRYAKDYYKGFVKETNPNPDPIVPNFKKEVQPKTERLPEPAAASQPLPDKNPKFELTVQKDTGTPQTASDVAREQVMLQREADAKFLAQQKKLVREKPLTLGGYAKDNDMYGIGSLLYDYVVENVPNHYPRDIKYWKSIFGAKKLRHDFIAINRKIPSTVTKQEIADTNIARFNEQGELIDGYLKYIEDMNKGSNSPIKISPSTILKLIRNAPANNLITMEYNSADFAKEGLLYTNTAYDILKKMLLADNKIKGNFLVDNGALSSVTKIAQYDNRNIPQANFRYSNLSKLYDQSILGKAYYSQAGSFGSKMRLDINGRQEFTMDGGNTVFPMDSPATPAFSLLSRLKEFNRAIRSPDVKSVENDRIIKFLDSPVSTLGKGYEGVDPNVTIGDFIGSTQAATLRFDKRIGAFQRAKTGTPANPDRGEEPVSTFFNLLETRGKDGKMKSLSPFNEYPEMESYRTYGTENFFETVILINPKIYNKVKEQIPNFNLNPKEGNPKHFNRKLPTGEVMDAQILHIRGGIRAVHPTFGGKTISIDELQDDIGQGIQKRIKADQIQMAANRFKAEENARRIESGEPPIDDQWVKNLFLRSRTRENIDANFKESGRLLDPGDAKDAKLMKEPVVPDAEITRLYTTQAPSLPNPSEFLFDEAKKNSLQRNMFNLDDINANMYRDRLLTVADEMSGLAKPGMTRAEINQYNKLKNTFFDIQKIIPDISKRTNSKYDYKPVDGTETWGPLGMKYAIKKAARDGIDWVSINPYEITHHREGRRLGNLEFYGNSQGTGELFVQKPGTTIKPNELDELRALLRKESPLETEPRSTIDLIRSIGKKSPAKYVSNMNSSAQTSYRSFRSNRVANNPTATLPSFLREFAKAYGTEVKEIKVAKSDPKKRVKFIKKTRSINPNNGEEFEFDEHIGAMTLEEYDVYKTKKAKFTSTGYGGDLENAEVVIRNPNQLYEEDYYASFAIKIKPEFKDIPIKGYKKGGLAENPFKW